MTLDRDEGLSMSTDSAASEREELLEILKDKERRQHLASVVTKRTLAEQIREIRLARGWTQSDLAHATGKVQETISQLENPDYGSYTIKTLDRLAEAFGVILTVRFDPFSELVRRMTELSPEDLAVPDYEHDPGLHPASGIDLTTLTSERGDESPFSGPLRFPVERSGIPLGPSTGNTYANELVSLSDYRGMIAIDYADSSLVMER